MSYTMLIDPERVPTTQLNGGNMTLHTASNGLNYLLRLPTEILLEIVRLMDRKRDLLNLSLTCRKLEDVAARRLYEKVHVRIPISKSTQSIPWGDFPTFRHHVFISMQELTLRDAVVDSSGLLYFRDRQPTGSVDEYVHQMLRKIPPRQLRSFALLYHKSLTSKMVEILAERQAHCLQDLRFFGTDIDDSESLAFPCNLRTLHCRSFQTGEVLARLIEANQETLECLHIGRERELLENYRRYRVGFLEQMAHRVGLPRAVSDLGRLCKLQHLKLCGLDLGHFLPYTAQSISLLWRLKSLAIESCGASTQFLDTISAAFRRMPDLTQDQTEPSLTSFVFRHEALSGHLKEALIHFLTSFTGLEELALLFENATLVERPSAFIAGHGKFLKSLVIESRIQPREHLGLDTSRPLGIGSFSNQLWQESINDVCNLCPNLIELGIAFPWDDEMSRLRKTKLATLKHLRTIHLRNFPQSQVLSKIGDYAIQEYARKFIDFCFPPLVGSNRPGLETLAIGPTLYENRWKHSSGGTEWSWASNSYRQYFNPPEYLRTHYFCLDWARTRFQRWNVMVTAVSEKCLEELRDERPLEGIFAHVWLR